MGKQKTLAGDRTTIMRLVIPKEDADVLEWLRNQYNVSMSVRQIIRGFIQTYGMLDVFCVAVPRGDAGAMVHSAPAISRQAMEQAPMVRETHLRDNSLGPRPQAPAVASMPETPAPAAGPSPGQLDTVKKQSDAVADMMSAGLIT